MGKRGVFVLLVLVFFGIFFTGFGSAYSIDKLNQVISEKGGLWTAADNPLWNLDDSEKIYKLGISFSEEDYNLVQESKSATIPERGFTQLPKNFDWRNYQGKNYITPIRNQWTCGSCWAFADAAAIEGRITAYYNNPSINPDLSEQQLVSDEGICYLPGTCHGGSPSGALNYVTIKGLTNDSNFPYGIPPFPYGERNCLGIPSDWNESAWKISSYFSGGIDENTIKWNLINYGPLVTVMDVYQDFYAYHSGIYFPVSTSDEYLVQSDVNEGEFVGGHAVVLVGYGTYDGLDYWIIKNSWGDYWGENGFMNILAGTSKITGYYTLGIGDPIVPPMFDYDVVCEDNDLDGYCYWGTSGAKPTTGCPVCDDIIWDCDDTDESIYENCGVTIPGEGILSIDSVPQDAKVYVKDNNSEVYFYRGQTPITFDLDSGIRDVMVSKEGYQVHTDSVEINESETTFYDVTLTTWPIINLSSDFVRYGDVVDINGSATGLNFSNYSVEWRYSNETWNTTGIVLENSGLSPVGFGRLATFDTNVLERYNYNLDLRLRVFTIDGRILEFNQSLVVDPDYKFGWPKKAENYFKINTVPVLVDDLNSDGRQEIIFQETSNQFLYAKTNILKSDGSEFSGWPIYDQEDLVAIPSSSDLNGDKKNEIVFISEDSVTVRFNNGSIFWQDKNSSYIFYNYSVPIISDLDGDGEKEIVVLGRYNMALGYFVYIYNSDGSMKNLAQVNVFLEPSIPPAVGDVDGDGRKEIFFAGLYDDGFFKSTRMILLDYQGNIISGWPITDSFRVEDYLMADLDKDGSNEIISYGGTDMVGQSRLHVMDLSASNLVGFPLTLTTSNMLHTNSLNVGDFFGDSNLEIAVSAYNSSFGDVITILDKDGNVLSQIPGKSSSVERAVGDLNGDFVKDFIEVNNGYLGIVGSNGNSFVHFPKPIDKSLYRDDFVVPYVGDLNGDGNIDTLLGTDEYIFVWDVSSSYNYSLSDWQMFRANPEHTGEYVVPQKEINYDKNRDGEIDVIDMSLETFWQGKETVDSDWSLVSHLDLNDDGFVNFADVWEIVLRI